MGANHVDEHQTLRTHPACFHAPQPLQDLSRSASFIGSFFGPYTTDGLPSDRLSPVGGIDLHCVPSEKALDRHSINKSLYPGSLPQSCSQSLRY